jgi:hypothetical protein
MKGDTMIINIITIAVLAIGIGWGIRWEIRLRDLIINLVPHIDPENRCDNCPGCLRLLSHLDKVGDELDGGR